MNPMSCPSSSPAPRTSFQLQPRRLKPLVGLSLTVSLSSSILSATFPARPSWALPPPEDQPEEVLRTEIILEGRSPKDGSPITAAEYAQLQAELEAENQQAVTLAPEVRRIIFLLRVRKVLRTILPFIP